MPHDDPSQPDGTPGTSAPPSARARILASFDRRERAAGAGSDGAADGDNGTAYASSSTGKVGAQQSSDTLDPGDIRHELVEHVHATALAASGAAEPPADDHGADDRGQGADDTRARDIGTDDIDPQDGPEADVREAEDFAEPPAAGEAHDPTVASTLQSASNLDFNLPGVASSALATGNDVAVPPHAQPEDSRTSLNLDVDAERPADPTAVTMLMEPSGNATDATVDPNANDDSGTAVNLALATDSATSTRPSGDAREESHTKVSLDVAGDLDIPPLPAGQPSDTPGAASGPAQPKVGQGARKGTSTRRPPLEQGSGVRPGTQKGSGIRPAAGSGVRPGTRVGAREGSGVRPATQPGSGVRPGRPPTRGPGSGQRPPTQMHTRSGTRTVSRNGDAMPPTITNMSAGQTVESPAVPPVGSLQRDPFIDLDVGGCKIIEKVGEGGMGAVYKARHLGLDKIVAIKILPPHLTDSPHRIERFKREAKSAAQMEHPNIVQILNVGEQDGIHFIIMQFIQGEDLRKRLKREGTIPPDEVIDIAIQICKGLKIAHEKLIVHRDIKPDNIMFDEEGRVKITDFGLAKGIDQDVEISNPGRAVGTPYYMSPEQCASREIDGRSDIYSLGATLFHMATGSRPFQGETPVATALMHLREPLTPPRQVNPDVPEVLDAIVRRMMQKLPEDRYQDCTALVDALEAADSAIRGHSPLSSVRDIIGYTGPSTGAQQPASGERPPIAPIGAAGASGRATTGIRRDGSRAGALVAGGSGSGSMNPSAASAVQAGSPGADPTAPGADGPFAGEDEPAPPKTWWPFAVLGAGALVFIVCLAVFLSSGSPENTNASNNRTGSENPGSNRDETNEGPQSPTGMTPEELAVRAKAEWEATLGPRIDGLTSSGEIEPLFLAVRDLREFLKPYAATPAGQQAQARLDGILNDLNARRRDAMRALEIDVDRALTDNEFARAERHVKDFNDALLDERVTKRLEQISNDIVRREGEHVDERMRAAQQLLNAPAGSQTPTRFFDALAIYHDLEGRISLRTNKQRVRIAAQAIEDEISNVPVRWNDQLKDQLRAQAEAARKLEIYIVDNFPDKLKRGELADLRNVIEALPRQIPDLQALRGVPAQLLAELAILQQVWDRLPRLLGAHGGSPIKLREPRSIGSSTVHSVRGPFEDCDATEFTAVVDGRKVTFNYSDLSPTELIGLLEDRYGRELKQAAPEWARYYLLSQEDAAGLRSYMLSNGLRPQTDELHWRFRSDLRGNAEFLRVYEVLDQACEAALEAREGNTAEAQRALNRVLIVHERLGVARLALADMLLRAGDAAGALQQIERCLMIEQSDPPAQLLAARANLQLGFTATTTNASRMLFNAAFTASDAIVSTYDTMRSRADAGGPDAEMLRRLYDATAGYYLPQAYTIRALCYLLRADKPVYIFAANDLTRALEIEPYYSSANNCLRAKNAFEPIDRNGDGLLTRAEWPADAIDAISAKYDIAPRDGTVTLIEFLGVELSNRD